MKEGIITSVKKKHIWLSSSPPPQKKKKMFLMVRDYTRMSHYKETFFKAGIPACRSKRVKNCKSQICNDAIRNIYIESVCMYWFTLVISKTDYCNFKCQSG